MAELPDVAVVGLGYAGLPLACALARTTRTVGYDHDPRRISDLADGRDPTNSASRDELASPRLELTADPAALATAPFVIVSVPTPVDNDKRPDLGPLRSASRTVGAHIAPGAVVVYESTVYPGVTQEVCVPLLEKASGLHESRDFHVGYSPERINPGDSRRGLRNIMKVIAAENPATLDIMERVYSSVTEAGVHRVTDIRTAEAAKVIENVQRDVNIALMNELTVLFHEMDIDTAEVLRTAGTKWNFAPYRPGLVGGHCIGVDPYYLSYAARRLGLHPEMILAGRRINDNMARYVADQTIRQLKRAGKNITGSSILLLGLAYKPNVPDPRNTLVVPIALSLEEAGAEVAIHDPLIRPEQIDAGLRDRLWPSLPAAADQDAIVLAVAHDALADLPTSRYVELLHSGQGSPVVIDLTGTLDAQTFRDRGILFWQL